MKKWKPKMSEKYWLIDGFDLYCLNYMNDRSDKYYMRMGNCFRTRKEAEQKLKEIKLILKK